MMAKKVNIIPRNVRAIIFYSPYYKNNNVTNTSNRIVIKQAIKARAYIKIVSCIFSLFNKRNVNVINVGVFA